jgi:DNA (cytosine-5)-methyltransferase 1
LKAGDLDLLAGCPPCQGFSTIRRLNKPNAVRDNRNSLIDDFQRLALEVYPRMVMLENVPGIEKYKKFVELVRALKRVGYSVEYDVLDVSDFEVPQRRKRLILVGNRVGPAKLAEKSSEKVTVRDAITKLSDAGSSGDDLHDAPARRSPHVQALIELIPKDGGSRHSLPLEMQLACHKGKNGFNDVYGRMRWDDVAPTITSGCVNPSKGRFIHPEHNRAITLREAALLQGFPQGYKFDLTHGKEAISLMIGNALPPTFIKKHALAMLEGLK